MDRSDYKQGLDKYKQAMGESLAIYRRLDRPADIVRVLIFIAYAAQNGGYFEEAESYFADGIALGRELDAADGVVLGLLGQGEMEWRRGNYPQAVGLLSESLELFATQDDSRGIAASTATLGGALLRQGDLGRAGELLRESLHVRHEIGDLGGLPWNLEHLAELSMAGTPSDDSAARAARLLGAAKGLRDRTGSWIYLADQGDYERLVTSIQHRLSEVAFIAAWESGRMMCLEEAVAYALEPDVAELAAASASSPLSKRERQVLHLVVDGRTNQEIADALFISHHTVANHLTSIMNKLGVDSRTAAATWAVKQGIA